MTPDHFARFGLPRRPWLEPAALKESFHRLTALTHPDRTGEAGPSAEVNAAYAELSDPARRLRHLLELEHPESLAGSPPVPPALAEIFIRLATLRRALEAFAGQQSLASTPLAQALLHAERFTLLREVEKELLALDDVTSCTLEQVQALDGRWAVRDAALVAQLAALQQELAYFGKWQGQLREARFHLESGVPSGGGAP